MVTEIPPEFFLLLPLSIAAGMDLYLTLFAVTVVSGLGIGAWTGPFVSPQGGGPVLLGLAGLFLAEIVMDSRPFAALAWHNLQLLLRPVGAALLGLLVFQNEPLGVTALGVCMASVVAAFSHVLVWGKGVTLRIAPGQRLPPMWFKTMSTVMAMALIALTVFHPNLGAYCGTLLLLLGLTFGRDFHGAVRFGWALLVDRVWGIVSPTEWQERERLPTWIVETAPWRTMNGLRGARAATWGVVGSRRFRDGWILQRNRDLHFAFRRGSAPQFIPLDKPHEKVEAGPIAKTIQYRSGDGASSALFLQLGLNGPESHK